MIGILTFAVFLACLFLGWCMGNLRRYLANSNAGEQYPKAVQNVAEE
jgi:hypothetical protein